MTKITDAMRADRYRRKLQDLLEAQHRFLSEIDTFFLSDDARAALTRLVNERQIIQGQFEMEEAFKGIMENRK